MASYELRHLPEPQEGTKVDLRECNPSTEPERGTKVDLRNLQSFLQSPPSILFRCKVNVVVIRFPAVW